MDKNQNYYNKCLEILDDLFVEKDRLRPKDFAEKLAPVNCAEINPDWDNLTTEERETRIKSEIKSISSSIRKVLNKLHRDGKIGRIGNSYISITEVNLKKAEEYLFNHLRPSQKMVNKISEGTYILSLEKEAVPYDSEFSFSKEYDGNIQKMEADLKKITEFIFRSEKMKADQVIKRRELSSYLKSYIGDIYCYDVLVEDERVIILLNIEAVKKDTDMSEKETKDTENDIVAALNDLTERIYESNHPKLTLKKDGVKRIEGDRYVSLEEKIKELVLKKGKLSRKTLIEELNLTTYQAGHMLKRMVDNGKLNLEGSSGAGAYYRLIKKANRKKAENKEIAK